MSTENSCKTHEQRFSVAEQRYNYRIITASWNSALFQQNPLFIGKTTGSSVARKFPFFHRLSEEHISVFSRNFTEYPKYTSNFLCNLTEKFEHWKYMFSVGFSTIQTFTVFGLHSRSGKRRPCNMQQGLA